MAESSKLQRAPLIVIEADPTLTITGWNRTAELVLGTDAAAARGRSLDEVLPLAAGSWSALTEAAEPGARVWSVRRGEATLSLEGWAQVERDGDGRPTEVTLYAHDISARVAAEARAALEATVVKAIKDNLDLALWAIDERGTFIYQDGKAHASVGVPGDFLIGKNISEFFSEPTTAGMIQRALGGEPMHRRSAELYGHYWDTHYVPVKDDPNGARLVGVTLNVTDSARTEEELRAKIELIERQQEVIRELATPIIEVWDGVLTMPIVGLVDTARAAEIMDNLLQAVTRTRAGFAILDLTGVEVVDTGTASHLIKLIGALRLLGAEGILTGIHATVAQTMVSLGIDLSTVIVHATLRDALKHCIRVGRGR